MWRRIACSDTLWCLVLAAGVALFLPCPAQPLVRRESEPGVGPTEVRADLRIPCFLTSHHRSQEG